MSGGSSDLPPRNLNFTARTPTAKLFGECTKSKRAVSRQIKMRQDKTFSAFTHRNVPLHIQRCQVKTCHTIPNPKVLSQSMPCLGRNFHASGSVPCRKHLESIQTGFENVYLTFTLRPSHDVENDCYRILCLREFHQKCRAELI